MQAVALSSKHEELGATIASFSVTQLILISLVKNGLISKREAMGRLRAAIANNKQIGLPGNEVAAVILKRLLGEVAALKDEKHDSAPSSGLGVLS